MVRDIEDKSLTPPVAKNKVRDLMAGLRIVEQHTNKALGIAQTTPIFDSDPMTPRIAEQIAFIRDTLNIIETLTAGGPSDATITKTIEAGEQRPGATTLSRAVQTLTAQVDAEWFSLSLQQVIELLGAARLLHEMVRGAAIIRKQAIDPEQTAKHEIAQFLAALEPLLAIGVGR